MKRNTPSRGHGKDYGNSQVERDIAGPSEENEMRKVKLLAYIAMTALHYIREDAAIELPLDWIRQPHLDLEGEIPE